MDRQRSKDELLIDWVRAALPGVKTQAQYDACACAVEATRVVLAAIHSGDAAHEAEARKALEVALEAARKAVELSRKLDDEPEVAPGSADVFRRTPAEFEERDISVRLLSELQAIATAEELQRWYAATRGDRERVISQALRNDVLDAVRAKARGFVR